jgi:hypothetical protein
LFAVALQPRANSLARRSTRLVRHLHNGAAIMRSLVGCFILVTACTSSSGPVTYDPDEVGPDDKADAPVRIVDTKCQGMPDAGAKKPLRHTSSKLVIQLGSPHHRGIDLIATDTDDVQVIRGEVSYGPFDKALEDENVDVYACLRRAWVHLGTARTDGEGAFALELEGDDRLPLGFRDMALSVAGDRTAARFLAVVAEEGVAKLAVTDVDGTLTTSEEAFAANTFGIDADIHDGAADTWKHVASINRVPVYVTARARMFTSDTREWLAKKGMPRGVLRLAPQVILPGSATVAFKTETLEALPLPITLAVGNRASDIDAYTNAGVDADRIFIKLPEFSGEVAPRLQAGDAVGFTAYPGPLSNL